MRKSKAHNDEIGERLGLNDSIYFKANSLTLGVPGVHVSLQTYVTIWLVAYPWAAHWHWSVIPGVWTAYICSQMYTHMHWKRAEEGPFYFQLSSHQSVGLSARWCHGVRRRGVVGGGVWREGEVCERSFWSEEVLGLKQYLCSPWLNVLVIASVRHGVEWIKILVC